MIWQRSDEDIQFLADLAMIDAIQLVTGERNRRRANECLKSMGPQAAQLSVRDFIRAAIVAHEKMPPPTVDATA